MMILKCVLPTKAQQDILLKLFAEYSTLFYGKMGKVPNFKVNLELKQDSKPFCARAQKIPYSILDVAKKEVEELCQTSVLEANIYSEWGAPALCH